MADVVEADCGIYAGSAVAGIGMLMVDGAMLEGAGAYGGATADSFISSSCAIGGCIGAGGGALLAPLGKAILIRDGAG